MASEVMERDLYNGKYHVVHNPNARGSQPRYVVNGTERPKGVTTILGKTLSKDLMQWAVDACCDYLRTKLPVITEQDLGIGAKEYIRLREAGGTTGSEAHKLVEDALKSFVATGEIIGTPPQVSPEARNAYNAFIKWFSNTSPVVLNVEETIYSAQYHYCGTYDGMLQFEGKTYMTDMKTTNPSKYAPQGVYAEMFIQLGAYWLAHEEQRLYELENGGTQLVEVDDLAVISAKKNGVLDLVRASDLGLAPKQCGDMFKRIVNVYQFMEYTSGKLLGK
jgi:hypothetical protein